MTCVREGAETPLFKQNFTDWLNKDETTPLIKPKKVSVGGGGEREREGREGGKGGREGAGSEGEREGRSKAKFLCFIMYDDSSSFVLHSALVVQCTAVPSPSSSSSTHI